MLANADRLRDAFVHWARGQAAAGFRLAVLACAAATVSPAWLVGDFRLMLPAAAFPMSRACARGTASSPARINSDQVFWRRARRSARDLRSAARVRASMGASIGNLFGEWFHLGWRNSRVLLAAGAGAGLAAAFNAPVAGAIWSLEELTREFELQPR